jgi:hypothetical protein
MNENHYWDGCMHDSLFASIISIENIDKNNINGKLGFGLEKNSEMTELELKPHM